MKFSKVYEGRLLEENKDYELIPQEETEGWDVRLIDKYPDIFEEIRGTGLMLGIKCKCPNLDFVQEGYEKAILTVPASDNVVRLLPALNITIEEINEALSRLEQTANSLRIAK